MKNKILMMITWSILAVSMIGTSMFPSATYATDSYTLGKGGFRWQETMFNPDVPDAENFSGNVADDKGVNSLLDTVRTVINRILGLLAFIALLFLLYGGFKILIAGTDEGAVDDAIKIVKNAAYGILFIAISWLIVTFIFYIAGILTDDSGKDWANKAPSSEIPNLNTTP